MVQRRACEVVGEVDLDKSRVPVGRGGCARETTTQRACARVAWSPVLAARASVVAATVPHRGGGAYVGAARKQQVGARARGARGSREEAERERGAAGRVGAVHVRTGGRREQQLRRGHAARGDRDLGEPATGRAR